MTQWCHFRDYTSTFVAHGMPDWDFAFSVRLLSWEDYESTSFTSFCLFSSPDESDGSAALSFELLDSVKEISFAINACSGLFLKTFLAFCFLGLSSNSISSSSYGGGIAAFCACGCWAMLASAFCSLLSFISVPWSIVIYSGLGSYCYLGNRSTRFCCNAGYSPGGLRVTLGLVDAVDLGFTFFSLGTLVWAGKCAPWSIISISLRKSVSCWCV